MKWTTEGPASRVSLSSFTDASLTSAAKLDAIVEHWMRFEFEAHGLYHAVFHTVATNSDEPLEAARALLGDVVRAGLEAGEFELDDLDASVVVEFLLNGYIGPCFHQADPAIAIANVQRLFRRALGAPS